jgi:hypothetical protein
MLNTQAGDDIYCFVRDRKFVLLSEVSVGFIQSVYKRVLEVAGSFGKHSEGNCSCN